MFVLPKLNIKNIRLFGLLILILLISACHTPTPKDGYIVDASHQATGADQRIQLLVFHYTAENFPDALNILTQEKVSAHYLVPANPTKKSTRPTVLQLVPENMRAWHAGASSWQGRNNLNDSSIGIEIENMGYTKASSNREWDAYTPEQIELLILLSKDIIKRHQILPNNIVGHSDIAPQRKNDPGPAFPWQQLAEAGVGAWPNQTDVSRHLIIRQAETTVDIKELQQNLARYGYDVPQTGVFDGATLNVMIAFQMHFRPTNYSGKPDAQTLAILDALLEKYRL